jgi:hypothetical protein
MPEFIMKRLRYYVEPTTLFHTALLNAGEEYANNKDYNALAYYNESGILFKKLNYEIGTAYNIGGNALCRNCMMKSNESDYISYYLLEKNRYISDYLTYMSDIYIKKNKPDKAL